MLFFDIIDLYFINEIRRNRLISFARMKILDKYGGTGRIC